MDLKDTSTPNLEEFNPTAIPFQMDVIKDVRSRFDYSLGTHEILLSGSVGSAKSLLMSHIGLTHVLMNPGARLCLCRRAMPDLKETILQKCLDHLDGIPTLKQGVHWEHNITKGQIDFSNGSSIISRSWHDKKYKKFRSLELSAALVEELTENDDEDSEFYRELKMRVGRLPHVKENFIMCATNPDSPGHWAYKYFIDSKTPTRHVYYSKTSDNPFLPKQYIEQLERDLDPKTARRMLYGEWIEIQSESIYYEYTTERNYRDVTYRVNPAYPILISWDFNIGEGKPMSCVLMQYIGDTFHIFGECVMDSARTMDVLDELNARNVFRMARKYIIHGDASGRHRDTRNIKSDYDIIREYLSNIDPRVEFDIDVPTANPALRARHNRVNAYCHSNDGRVRLYVYRDAPTAHEGLRLTALKKGGNYVEDDSKRFQHITTAIGYSIMQETNEKPELIEFNRWGGWKF